MWPKGKRLKSVAFAGIQPQGVLLGRRASITFDHRKRALEATIHSQSRKALPHFDSWAVAMEAGIR